MGARHAEDSGDAEFGKPVRFGDADPGRGRRKILLGLNDIRSALQEIRRKTRRHGRRQHLLGQGATPRNLVGHAAQENAQLILLLDHLPFKLGGPRRRVRPFRFELVGIQLRDDALTKAGLSDTDRLFPGFERPPCDIELHVELQQIEVGLGHAADELENHGTTAFLACEQVSPSRLVRPADTAPDVEFP